MGCDGVRTRGHRTWAVMEYTRTKPWPFFMYRSRMAVNCSVPAVSRISSMLCCPSTSTYINIRPVCHVIDGASGRPDPLWADINPAQLRATSLLRVKAKITVKNAVYVSLRRQYTVFLPVILALTLKSGCSESVKITATVRRLHEFGTTADSDS